MGKREHPILFSGPMIQAILSGTKSQTRRVIKPQPRQLDTGKWYWQKRASDNGVYADLPHGRWWEYAIASGECPYQVGMTLWVRETWRELVDTELGHNFVAYRADGKDLPPHHPEFSDRHWRPSIFMPRWASRITMEITDVRVQRVNEISEEDAKAEGVGTAVWPRLSGVPEMETVSLGPPMRACYRNAFATLWDSINAKRGYSFDSGVWVWCVSFKRV